MYRYHENIGIEQPKKRERLTLLHKSELMQHFDLFCSCSVDRHFLVSLFKWQVIPQIWEDVGNIQRLYWAIKSKVLAVPYVTMNKGN